MTSKLSTIGKWISATIAAIVIVARHSWGPTRSTREPTRTRNISPEHSRPSLTAPNNLAPNQETPLNPQNRHPLTSQSPLPRHTSTQVDKLVPKRHHSGSPTFGRTHSTPETQKTS